MARFTTVVAVIGPEAGDLIAVLAREATNVGAVRIETLDDTDIRRRRRVAWRDAQRRKGIYTLVDFDPMEPVVAAWGARLTGTSHELELEVGLTEPVSLPDYVFVIDEIDGPEVQWYHGFLHGLAPRRVVPIAATPAAIHDALRRLRPEREFPTADIVAREALDHVPIGLTTERTDDVGAKLELA